MDLNQDSKSVDYWEGVKDCAAHTLNVNTMVYAEKKLQDLNSKGLSQINKDSLKYIELMKEDIKKDIVECYPVSMDGSNIILLNSRIYYNGSVFYSFNEFFNRIDINECKYNKTTYMIADRG